MAIILFSVLMSGCSDNKVDEQRFFKVYEEVLQIRSQYEDTAVANPKVKELLKKNNYTNEQFKEEFLELSKNSEVFLRKLDSIRVIAKVQKVKTKDE